jgi:GMP synthase (glutamine-hydrolysing)
MSHGDSIIDAPPGFTALATTDSTPFAALADTARNLWGIQFHPEVVHTPSGKRLLQNFVLGIAKAKATWTPGRLAEDAVAAIKAQVGPTDRVLCALSGGVDSAVAAALVHKAIGDRLTCVYVDHGLMRKRESEILREVFAEQLGMKIIMVKAQ